MERGIRERLGESHERESMTEGGGVFINREIEVEGRVLKEIGARGSMRYDQNKERRRE